jgi:hypothetical protein
MLAKVLGVCRSSVLSDWFSRVPMEHWYYKKGHLNKTWPDPTIAAAFGG